MPAVEGLAGCGDSREEDAAVEARGFVGCAAGGRELEVADVARHYGGIEADFAARADDRFVAAEPGGEAGDE